jgi:TonB-dependent starch-binding outer membrane protein SusC
MHKLLPSYCRIGLMALICFSWHMASGQYVASLHHPKGGVKQDQVSNRISLELALKDLQAKHQVSFLYNSEVVQNKFITADHALLGNLAESLTTLLAPINLRVERINETLFVIITDEGVENLPGKGQLKRKDEAGQGEFLPHTLLDEVFQSLISRPSAIMKASNPAVITVTGRVTSESGEGLAGASVVLKGSSIGATTNPSGIYSLSLPDDSGNGILVFSYIGYIIREVPLQGRTEVNISMALDTKLLSEMVVVGYGTQRKTDVTGALSSISTKEFEQQPVTRVDQILQGRAAGVQVTNAGGAPGGEVRIRIRGANSIFGDNSPLYVVDGYVGADFTTINPNDIESIQVLKDASSTAIYGSRGANGVIIITTKKGSAGGIKVHYNGQATFSEVLKRYNTLGAGEFAEIVNTRSAATGTAPIFTPSQVEDFKRNGGTDWQDEIFRQAWGQEHQLGVSGGNEKTTFLLSSNYLNQDGIIKNSDFQRYTLRSNIASQVTDKLSLRLNLTGSRMINHNTSSMGFGTGSPLIQALAWAPTTPVYNANGNYTMNDPVGSVKENPVALLFNREINVERTLANVVGGIRYEFVPGLALDVQYAVNYLNQQNKRFNGPFVSQNNPNANRASTEQITLQSTNALSYRRTFNDVHTIDAVGVFETQEFVSNTFSAQGNTLKDPSLSYYNIGLAGSFAVTSGYAKWTLLSYLGRVNYSFLDRYLLSASLRRDGSSKFQGDNKYSVFPSLAAGWRVSEEAFMQNVNLFSNLKLRGSWGLTGSQAINPYATHSTYSTNPLVAFTHTGASSGIFLGNPGNPNLRWETTEQINVGAEMEFLNGRITVEGDYFVKNTRDLLLNQPLPGYVGGGNIARNLGEIENKGWELSIGATVLEKGSFNWTSSFNISNVQNTVVSVGGIANRLFTNTNVGAGMSTQSEYVYAPGQALGSYWGLRYLGTWKPNQADEAAKFNAKPGDSRYQDLNGDNTITTADFQIIGSGIPRTSAGLNNTFAYKGLTLNVFIQGVFGFDKLHYTKAAALAGGADARQALLVDIRERYIPGVNETSDIPAFSRTNMNYTQSSRFLEKGDFLRLKNVSLSYALPTSLVRNIGAVSVFISGMNLYTLTKYTGIDPESSSLNGADTALGVDYGSYPNSRIYTTGLNFTF